MLYVRFVKATQALARTMPTARNIMPPMLPSMNPNTCSTRELTVVEKIWGIILEVVAVVAELTGMDDEVMLELIIHDNKRLAAFQALAQSA